MALVRYLLMSLTMMFIVQPAAAQDNVGPHVRIELIAETDRPAAGSEVTLAFFSTPEKEWHAYWENPGDAGLPARAEWTLPAGMSAGAIRYPVPERLLISDLMNYVYEHPFAPLVTVKVPAGLTPGTRLPIAVKLDYLVCTREICVPEKAQLSTELTVGDGAVAAERRARFDDWRKALPRPLGSAGAYQVEGKTLRLGIPFPAESAAEGEIYFYPLTDGAIDYAAPQRGLRDGDRIVIETTAKSPKSAIQGVLAFGQTGFTVTANPGTVPPASASATAVGTGDSWLVTALLSFLGAVLGGLILNIMPCVFPILSLKALSLAKANDEGGNPRADALAYTAGLVLTCLVLGGILLALRAGGGAVGWAFQLTDPRAVLVLLLLVTGIALNLAGLFEMAAPGFVNRASARGAGGSFLTGALAAFVATPCAGPFMGVALGAALVLPWFAAMAVFAGLGLGMALPFLLIGFVPALRRRLPKPGAWMATLRHILSVPMFLTALALAWVLGKQAGVDGMAWGLGAALLFSFGLWWTGQRQVRGKSGAWWPAMVLGVVSLGTLGLVRNAPAQALVAAGNSQPFSETKLSELTAAGKPVFAYFTADWCLTCKVNEKAVIERAEVQKLLADRDVTVLVGDWTNGDPVLGRFIEKHNRAGVPLYLWYKPGEATPRVLPQILTQAMLRDLAGGTS